MSNSEEPYEKLSLIAKVRLNLKDFGYFLKCLRYVKLRPYASQYLLSMDRFGQNRVYGRAVLKDYYLTWWPESKKIGFEYLDYDGDNFMIDFWFVNILIAQSNLVDKLAGPASEDKLLVWDLKEIDSDS